MSRNRIDSSLRASAGRSGARWSWVLLALILPACTLLPRDRETLQIFDLHAPPITVSNDGVAESWQLAVSAFTARVPLAGERMAVRERGGGFSVVSGARWSLPAPKLLQAVTVQAFEDSGRIAGVGPADTLRGDCRLGGELRAFHWEPEAGRVEVELAARLHCGPMEEVAGMRRFRTEAAVSGSGPAALASAMERALAGLVPDLVAWVVETGSAALEPPGTLSQR